MKLKQENRNQQRKMIVRVKSSLIIHFILSLCACVSLSLSLSYFLSVSDILFVDSICTIQNIISQTRDNVKMETNIANISIEQWQHLYIDSIVLNVNNSHLSKPPTHKSVKAPLDRHFGFTNFLFFHLIISNEKIHQ